MSNDKAVTEVVKVLRDAFGPGVDFELCRESDRIYRVKATAKDDASIDGGLEKMRVARAGDAGDGDLTVKLISDDDASEYLTRAAATLDPVARAGYQQLAIDARGQ